MAEKEKGSSTILWLLIIAGVGYYIVKTKPELLERLRLKPLKLFRCPQCGAMFDTEEALEEHIKEFHPTLSVTIPGTDIVAVWEIPYALNQLIENWKRA